MVGVFVGDAVNGITFTYDNDDNGLGLLTKSQQDHEELANGNSADVQYTYDMTPTNNVITGAARLTQVTYPGPSGSRRAVYYNLATSGLWAGIDRLDNIAKAGGTPKYAEFTYMGAGAMVKEAHPEVTNGLTLDYDVDNDKAYKGFDNVGRIIDQRWQNDTPTVKDQFKYTYDRASNRTSRDVGPDMASPPSGFDEYYLSDGLHRLMKMNRGDLDSGSIADGDAAYSQAWAFWNTDPETDRWDTELDAVGNWTKFKIDNGGGGPEDVGWELKQTRTNNEVNEITGISKTVGDDWYDPAYNANGNMLSGPMPGDEDDPDGTEHHYLYDAWNRLKVVYIDGDDDDVWDDGSPDTLVAKFEYDGLHRRIVKIVPNEGTPTKRDRTDYYYNTSWQVLEEKLAVEVLEANEGDEATLAKYQYVWSPRYIDAPVLRDADTDETPDGDCTDSPGSERLYYCNDANMNVTALVETDGDVVERYSYDPYGRATFHQPNWDLVDNDPAEDGTASAYDNEILYCGYRHDPETGLYHVRRRPYHPTIGRWLTRDPIGYADGMSLYEYVGSGPTRRLDPMGTDDLGLDVLEDGLGPTKSWKEYHTAEERAKFMEETRVLKEKLPGLATAAGDLYPKQEVGGLLQGKRQQVTRWSFQAWRDLVPDGKGDITKGIAIQYYEPASAGKVPKPHPTLKPRRGTGPDYEAMLSLYNTQAALFGRKNFVSQIRYSDGASYFSERWAGGSPAYNREQWQFVPTGRQPGVDSYTVVDNVVGKYYVDEIDTRASARHRGRKVNLVGFYWRFQSELSEKALRCCGKDIKDYGLLVFSVRPNVSIRGVKRFDPTPRHSGARRWELVYQGRKHTRKDFTATDVKLMGSPPYVSANGMSLPPVAVDAKAGRAKNYEKNTRYRLIVCLTCEKQNVNWSKGVLGCASIGTIYSGKTHLGAVFTGNIQVPTYHVVKPAYGLLDNALLSKARGYKNVEVR